MSVTAWAERADAVTRRADEARGSRKALQGFTEGYTEGFTVKGSRGSRDERPLRFGKEGLSFKADQGPLRRRMEAQGFTSGLSCTPREPLVNPSNTPGEPLKPLKEKYDPFMRALALSRRHNPSFRSQGFTGFTADALAVLTGVAMVALLWWWTTVAMDRGMVEATMRLGLATVAMTGVALARREWSRPKASAFCPEGCPDGEAGPCVVGYPCKLYPAVPDDGDGDNRSLEDGLCSEVSASRGEPSTEPERLPIELDSQSSAVGSRL